MQYSLAGTEKHRESRAALTSATMITKRALIRAHASTEAPKFKI